MNETFRHIFLKRAGIILLVLMSFVNARFTETWHFHAVRTESGEFLKVAKQQSAISQESCSLCNAAHIDIIGFKNLTCFFFVKKATSLPFFIEVLKTSYRVVFTPSRAPPVPF